MRLVPVTLRFFLATFPCAVRDFGPRARGRPSSLLDHLSPVCFWAVPWSGWCERQSLLEKQRQRICYEKLNLAILEAGSHDLSVPCKLDTRSWRCHPKAGEPAVETQVWV